MAVPAEKLYFISLDIDQNDVTYNNAIKNILQSAESQLFPGTGLPFIRRLFLYSAGTQKMKREDMLSSSVAASPAS